MIRLNKYVIFAVVFLLVNVILPFNGMSQAVSDPGCDPLDPLCPIDGGLSLLIAAGIGLGAKKAYDKKKNSVDL